jgi:hypothetical protein
VLLLQQPFSLVRRTHVYCASKNIGNPKHSLDWENPNDQLRYNIFWPVAARTFTVHLQMLQLPSKTAAKLKHGFAKIHAVLRTKTPFLPSNTQYCKTLHHPPRVAFSFSHLYTPALRCARTKHFPYYLLLATGC